MGNRDGPDDMHKRLLPGGDDGDHGDHGDHDAAPYEIPGVDLSVSDGAGKGALVAGGNLAEHDALDGAEDELAKHGAALAPAWQRKAVTVLVGVGVFCQYAMRSNLSVAMVDMPDRYGWQDGWTGPCLSAFFGVRGAWATLMITSSTRIVLNSDTTTTTLRDTFLGKFPPLGLL